MQTVRFPGWRTMTSAQRYNAKMDAMFERARQLGHTTFNAQKDCESIEYISAHGVQEACNKESGK